MDIRLQHLPLLNLPPLVPNPCSSLFLSSYYVLPQAYSNGMLVSGLFVKLKDAAESTFSLISEHTSQDMLPAYTGTLPYTGTLHKDPHRSLLQDMGMTD